MSAMGAYLSIRNGAGSRQVADAALFRTASLRTAGRWRGQQPGPAGFTRQSSATSTVVAPPTVIARSFAGSTSCPAIGTQGEPA